MNITICLSGKICSGKSTYSNLIVEKFDFPVISFGKYLVDYSKNHNLPVIRDALQDLGHQMVLDNAHTFLNNVLSFSNIKNENLIIEGVRHEVIYEELKMKSQKVLLIFVDAPVEIRYQRFIDRKKEGDPDIDFGEFLRIDSHKVESEAERLKMISDIIIDSTVILDESIKKEFLEKISRFIG